MAGDNGKLWVPIGYQESLKARPEMGEVSSAVDTLYLRYRIMPYNPDEVMKRKGIAKFHEMRRDDQVRAVLAMKKFSVLAPGWRIDPASEEPLDVEVAQFCEHVLDEMPGNITDVLLQVLSALDYGYSVTEIVYELLKRGQWVGKVGLKALKTRKPDFMDFDSDEFGNLKPDGILQKVGSDWRNLPVEKFLVYSYQKEFDNWYGTSDLSACYRAWWSKDCIFKFWNIFLERFGSPTALGKYQPNIPKAEKDALLNVLNDLQARTSITIPEGIEVSLLEATRGGAAGYDRAIEVHNRAITRALLYPDLLGLGERGATGSRALGEVQAAGFLPVLEKIARDMEQTVMVEQLIRRIVDFNFEVERYPQFAINSMTQEDKKAIAEVWIKAAQAGVVSLDEGDENYLRGLLGFPVKEHEPEGGEETPTKVGPPVVEKLALHSEPLAFSREPNKYEARLDWKPMREDLMELEDETVAAASQVVMKMRRRLEEQVAKKRIIEEKKAKEIEKLQLPYVGELRLVFKDFLRGAYELGGDGERMNLKKLLKEHKRHQVVTAQPLLPKEALEWFDAYSFNMAGVEADHIKQGVKQILYNTIQYGRTMGDAILELKNFLDPYVATGEVRDGQVSTAWRLETVIRTNSIRAYNEGRKMVTRDKQYRDFIVAYEYSAILDARTTDICRHLDGKIFDYDDPDVDRFTPPNHFNCRSTWVPVFWDDTYELISDAERQKADELVPKGFGGPMGRPEVPSTGKPPKKKWAPAIIDDVYREKELDAINKFITHLPEDERKLMMQFLSDETHCPRVLNSDEMKARYGVEVIKNVGGVYWGGKSNYTWLDAAHRDAWGGKWFPHILSHELAHQYQDAVVIKSSSERMSLVLNRNYALYHAAKEKNKAVTGYALTNDSEYFADSVAYMMHQPWELARVDREMYNFLNDKVFGGMYQRVPRTEPPKFPAYEQ